MASKNRNPYRKGSKYAEIFEFIRANQVVTRAQLLEAGFPVADVTVVLSPRAEGLSTRGGDCRGNYSAQGHVYFMDKLNKKKGEAKKFRLRYRKVALDQRIRPPKKEVASQKADASQKTETVKDGKTADATA
jgi:hypothetical protein